MEGDTPRSPLPLRFRRIAALFAVAVAVRADGDVGGLEDDGDDEDEPILLLYESDLACSPGRFASAGNAAKEKAARAEEVEVEAAGELEEEEEPDAGTEDESKLRLLRRAQMSKLVSILCERRRV